MPAILKNGIRVSEVLERLLRKRNTHTHTHNGIRKLTGDMCCFYTIQKETNAHAGNTLVPRLFNLPIGSMLSTYVQNYVRFFNIVLEQLCNLYND